MVKIVAEFKLKENCKPQFIELTKELIKGSQAEAGCIEYDLFQSREDELALTFIEAWKDNEAIELHNNSEHFTSIVPKLGEFIAESKVTLYDTL